MTDNELLLAISDLMDKKLKSELQPIKDDLQELKHRMTKIELHLEDRTDRNIELLAENHITLIDKLNQAIPAANKNLTYEVKVNYLLDRVSVLEKKVQVLETK